MQRVLSRINAVDLFFFLILPITRALVFSAYIRGKHLLFYLKKLVIFSFLDFFNLSHRPPRPHHGCSTRCHCPFFGQDQCGHHLAPLSLPLPARRYAIETFWACFGCRGRRDCMGRHRAPGPPRVWPAGRPVGVGLSVSPPERGLIGPRAQGGRTVRGGRRWRWGGCGRCVVL